MLEKSEHKLYELRNGVVYRKIDRDIILFYVPEMMENHVLYKYHDEMGHVGISKTLDIIKQNYWFPNMKKKIEDHISNCLKCIAFSKKNGKDEGFLHNIPKSTVPFDVVHIDHFGPIENLSRSKKYILVIIDASTKFVRLYSTKTTNTKEVIQSLKDYFRSYSRPKVIISDRGSSFTSMEFKSFMESCNIQHIKIATGSPQANGQVERINRSLGPMLAKLTEPGNKIFWDTVLENVEFAINNTENRSIGQHPSMMLFGTRQRGNLVDCLKENHLENVVKEKERDLTKIRSDADLKQQKTQEYNKKYVDQRRKDPIIYQEGDYVMVRNFDSTAIGPRKLIPKFKGPYEVHKVLKNDRYVLKDVENIQQTQIPYKGVWGIANIRPWLKSRSG